MAPLNYPPLSGLLLLLHPEQIQLRSGASAPVELADQLSDELLVRRAGRGLGGRAGGEGDDEDGDDDLGNHVNL